jgi:hypothetical protein
MAQQTIEMVRWELCRELQHPIYRLALRMLSSPEDAEAIAEDYKTDPEFVVPQRVYEGLRRAAPDLLL